MSRSWLLALALVSFTTSPALAQAEKPAVDRSRLSIGRSGGPQGGGLRSEQVLKDGRTVLHGLQVSYGPQLQIREYTVYNEGRCEQLVQFYANGNVFREQWRDHDGNGSEAIYAPEANQVVAEKVIVDGGHDIGPIKVQERICLGRVKAGKCFEGKFLIHELRGFQFHWTLQEFKDGKLVESRDFPLEKVGMTADQASEEQWRWTIPDWPQVK